MIRSHRASWDGPRFGPYKSRVRLTGSEPTDPGPHTWSGCRESNPHCQLGNLFGSGLPHGLTCGSGCPRVTAKDRSSPGLIAR